MIRTALILFLGAGGWGWASADVVVVTPAQTGVGAGSAGAAVGRAGPAGGSLGIESSPVSLVSDGLPELDSASILDAQTLVPKFSALEAVANAARDIPDQGDGTGGWEAADAPLDELYEKHGGIPIGQARLGLEIQVRETVFLGRHPALARTATVEIGPEGRSLVVRLASARDAVLLGSSYVLSHRDGTYHGYPVEIRFEEPSQESSGWRYLSNKAMQVLRVLHEKGMADGYTLMAATGFEEEELGKALEQLRRYPLLSLIAVAGDTSARSVASSVTGIVPGARDTIGFLLNKAFSEISPEALRVLRALRREGMQDGYQLMSKTDLDNRQLAKIMEELLGQAYPLIGVAGSTTESSVVSSVSSIKPRAQGIVDALLAYRETEPRPR